MEASGEVTKPITPAYEVEPSVPNTEVSAPREECW